MKLFDVFRIPPSRATAREFHTTTHHVNGALVTGMKETFICHISEHAFQGPVIEIAGSPEFGIVWISLTRERFRKKIVVTDGQRFSIHFDGLVSVFLQPCSNAEYVGDFRHRVSRFQLSILFCGFPQCPVGLIRVRPEEVFQTETTQNLCGSR